jgi:hypothetical protein
MTAQQYGEPRHDDKRNGADLAVDPTLAGSWAPKGTWRPGVSMPVPRSSCEHSRSASNRPALAPAPVPSGAEIDREDQLPAARRFRDLLVGLGLIAVSLCPKTPRNLGTRPAIRPSDFAPSRLQRSKIWIAPGRTFALSSSHSSTARHLAVASLRFQNPFFLAGLSAFVSEGPIPVSMIGRCAAWPIRASAGPSSYPLSA